MAEERLKIAVFIDFDNIEIGVKTTLNQHFDVGTVLEAIKERGEVVTKFAYGDWTRAGDYGRAMSQHAIHMVQRNLTPGGDKNGADINLALDALEMAFTHEHINSFVIVGGDSDFITLVEKLKQYDRKVFVVGGRAFTSMVMQKNCTEFIAYENLVSRGRPVPSSRASKTSSSSELAGAMPLVRRALKLLADREVLPQLGLLKSTLLQLDSAFSERDYGAGSFRDFVQKLANANFVALKGNERSFHVELRDAGEHAGAAVAEAPSAPPARDHERRDAREPRDGERRDGRREGPHDADRAEPEADRGERTDREAAPVAAAQSAEPGREQPTEAGAAPSPGESLRALQADGYRVIQRAFLNPSTPPRWPMYVRQVKQLIKVADDQFEERRFGFGGIIEALRYCQREGLLRLERDRMGVVRVFAGPQLLARPAGGDPGALDADGRPLDGQIAEPAADDAAVTGSVEGIAEPERDVAAHSAEPSLETADAPAQPQAVDGDMVETGDGEQPELELTAETPRDSEPSGATRGRRKTTGRSPRTRKAGASSAPAKPRSGNPRGPRSRKPAKKEGE